MLILDLQALVFILGLIWLASIFSTIWFVSWRQQKQRRASAVDAREIQSEWLGESTRLLSDLAHELRTPLAVLLTHLQVLRLPQLSEETRQQSIFLMQQEAKRMSRLVHDLLELGYLETASVIERRQIDLHLLLNQVMAQIAPFAEERHITIAVQADAGDLFTLGDADRLRQVFQNLLDNAIKYGRPGDKVIVSLQRELAREAIVCTVRDTGPGIPAEHLPHLTRRFYRVASEAIGGSGLGLAVVKEILRRHQSELEITSQTEGAETGTTVRFVLPALPKTGEQQ